MNRFLFHGVDVLVLNYRRDKMPWKGDMPLKSVGAMDCFLIDRRHIQEADLVIAVDKEDKLYKVLKYRMQYPTTKGINEIIEASWPAL